MAESPDFLPIAFSPYPPSPASYITDGFATAIDGTQTAVLHDFNTAHLFLIKRLKVFCTVYLNPGTTLEGGLVSIGITNGLNNTGPATPLDTVYPALMPGGVGAAGGAAYCTMKAPEPIVIRGNAGANVQQLVLSGNLAADETILLNFTLLAWQLD